MVDRGLTAGSTIGSTVGKMSTRVNVPDLKKYKYPLFCVWNDHILDIWTRDYYYS